MQHRREHRLDTDVGVRFVAMPATIGAGRIANISLTGAFMETASKLRLSSVVYIEGLDPDKKRDRHSAAKRLAATVVRCCSSGVELEWCAPYEHPLPGSRPDAAPPDGEADAVDEVNEESGASCCVYRLEFID
jgi:hypothetical protein